MKNANQRALQLLKANGVFYLLIKSPLYVTKVFLDTITTLFYRVALRHCGHAIHIEFGAKIEYPLNVELGSNIFIGKHTTITSEAVDSQLRIADNVEISRGCFIDYTGGLSIEADCLFSAQTIIYTHSHGHNPRSQAVPFPKTIGRNVWIGVRAAVMEGCTYIAPSCIVASGAVVANSIENPNTVCGGVPAKPIKQC